MSRLQEWEALRAEGATYREIAAKYGCSYQNVAQIMAKRNVKQFRAIKKTQCCFDGLRNWMNENRISISEVARRENGTNAGGCARSCLEKRLRGEQDMKRWEIEFFIDMTGLTYEQLFR